MDFWDGRFVRVEFPESTLYKVTNERNCSRNGTLWGRDVTRVASGVITNDGEMAINENSPKYWLHAYTHPVLAIFFNRIHNPRTKLHVWACTGTPQVMSPEGRVGCTKLTTHYVMPTPIITSLTRVRIAMETVRHLYTEGTFNLWSLNWIVGNERIGTVDRRMADWCWSRMKQLLHSDIRQDQGILAYAAWQVCEAAMKHQKDSSSDRAKLNYLTASASMLASMVAHKTNNKHFDMVKIIEHVMI